MKKKFVLALALALTLSLSACKKPEPTPAASSPEQSVTESTSKQTPPAESIPEQPESTAPVETTPEQSEPITPVESEPEQPEEATLVVEPEPVDLFTDTNETVYATSTVNIRSKPDTNSEKMGQLNWSDSVLRTGIGMDDVADWSEVQLSNGSIAYISSEYLSTTKPVEQKPAEQSKPVEQKPVEQKPVEQKPVSQAPTPSQTQQQEAQKKQEEQKAEQVKQEVSTKYSYPAGATTAGLTAREIEKGYYISGDKILDQKGNWCGWAPGTSNVVVPGSEREKQAIKETGEQYDGSGLYSDTSGFTG